MKYIDKYISIIALPFRKQFFFFVFLFLLGSICIFSDRSIEKESAFFQLFFDTYCLSFLLAILPKLLSRLAKYLLLMILSVLAIIDIFCIGRLGTGITPTLLQVILQTNEQEATEAILSYVSIESMSFYLMLVVLLLLLSFLFLLYRNNIEGRINFHSLFSSKVSCVILSILLLVSGIVSFRPHKFMAIFLLGDEDTMWDLGGKRNYRQGLIYYIPIYKFANSVKQISFCSDNLEKLRASVDNSVVETCTFSSPNIILVIGESHNKHHSGLYGYDFPTTPEQCRYSEQGNLIPFTDVLTSYNLTTESFQNMFSFFVYGDKEQWFDFPLFPAVFKKAGYHTAFITNQFTQSNDADMWDFNIGAYFNDKRISNALFDQRNRDRYEFDESILHDYDSLKQFKTDSSLIIFHLLGLHSSYHKRCPDNKRVFYPNNYDRKDLDEDQKQILADYDNAVYYNDYILGEIIRRFKDDDAVVIYVSDHGEECFDKCQTWGRPHKYEPVDLYQQIQIPFWIYMSDKYLKNHPDLANKIIRAKDMPIMTDVLPHFLIGLAGITAPVYNSSYDFLSEDYDLNRKRMIMGKLDYDKVMEGWSE